MLVAKVGVERADTYARRRSDIVRRRRFIAALGEQVQRGRQQCVALPAAAGLLRNPWQIEIDPISKGITANMDIGHEFPVIGAYRRLSATRGRAFEVPAS